MKKILILLALLSGYANAQQHTYKFIFSTGPGSGSDMTLNAFTPCFKKHNIQIQKEFRPGAEGLIAIRALQNSNNTPEVTHVLLGNFGLNMLSKFPGVDLLEDINPITYLSHASIVFIGKPGKSFDDIIKNNNGKPIMIGTSFHGGTWWAQNLFDNLKVPYQIIPYKNNVNATMDIVNGNLDLAVDTWLASKQLAESGRINILLSSFNKKDAKKYNLTSIEKYDAGLAAIPFGTIISVHPNTNPQYKELLEQTVIACNKDEETARHIMKLGGEPVIMTTENIRKIVKTVSTKK